jgi:hypothetical protein
MTEILRRSTAYPLTSRCRAVSVMVTSASALAAICSSTRRCSGSGWLSTVCSTTMDGTFSARSSGSTSAPASPG